MYICNKNLNTGIYTMFENLYKQSFNKVEQQEKRRKELLQQQKLKRIEQQDGSRQIETVHHERNARPRHIHHRHNFLDSIQLQTSEWFKEKPDDLDDWLLVPCPQGQRCLVVSEKGKTKMLSKKKRYRMTFSSLLPGGGINGSDGGYCLLDCIFNEEKDTFYVLDALYFAIPLIDCETEFRFFWLKSKLLELDDFKEKIKCDDAKSFQLLKSYDMSDMECLSSMLHSFPLWKDNQPQLDGFLFYHKKSHYVCGTTPLVCWLFPFMLPDILQLEVCSIYKTPVNYCKKDPWKYMDEFDKERLKKNKGNQNVFASRFLEMQDLKMIETPFVDCNDNDAMEYLSADN